MKNIYAFYTSIQLADQNEEFACSNWWKTSWEKLGWKTFMLNRSHAQGSHLYNKLASKMMNATSKLPQERRSEVDWLMARFSRWCALHAAGGGWMSERFFEDAFLNSPYECPTRHWELVDGIPTQEIVESQQRLQTWHKLPQQQSARHRQQDPERQQPV